MTPATREIAATMVRGARWYTVWLTAFQLVVIVAAAVGNGLANDPVTISVWQWPALLWIRYPLVAVGVAVTAGSLPVYVAGGVTRRQFAAGAGAFALALVTLLASMSVLGFVLERVVYAVLGVGVALDDERPLQLLVVYLVLLASYLVSGFLIGGAVSRWSPRVAPWMIALFVIPMIAAEVVLGTFWGGVENGDLNNIIPLALGVPLMVVVIAGAAGVWFSIVREIAIRPRKA